MKLQKIEHIDINRIRMGSPSSPSNFSFTRIEFIIHLYLLRVKHLPAYTPTHTRAHTSLQCVRLSTAPRTTYFDHGRCCSRFHRKSCAEHGMILFLWNFPEFRELAERHMLSYLVRLLVVARPSCCCYFRSIWNCIYLFTYLSRCFFFYSVSQVAFLWYWWLAIHGVLSQIRCDITRVYPDSNHGYW